MSPARPLALVVLALAAAGCGASSQTAPPAPNGPLAVLTPGARTLVVGGAGEPRTLPAGNTAGRTLFTARAGASATTVSAVDLRTGRTRAETVLPGRWHLPATVAGGPPDALSPTGSTLVLVSSDGGHSRFALLDSGLRGAP